MQAPGPIEIVELLSSLGILSDPEAEKAIHRFTSSGTDSILEFLVDGEYLDDTDLEKLEMLAADPGSSLDLRERTLLHWIGERLPPARSGTGPANRTAKKRETVRMGEERPTPHHPPGPLGLEPGTRIGNYVVLGPVGAGGMGAVYRVRGTTIDRVLAMKVILAGRLATAEQVERFKREARSTARLHHPSIVGIHDFGFEAGCYYFTMDFLAGKTLDERLRGGPLPAGEALALLRPVADAVHYAHMHGILHRDLKPANILLTPQGEPRLTDFGLARIDEEESARLTRTGHIIGTPAYMSPEQAAGRLYEIDEKSDVYSLGAILYQMLTGAPPFTGQTAMEIVQKVLREDPVPPRRLRPEIDRESVAICLKAMARRPDERYRSARALADDIARHQEGLEIEARPLSLAGRLRESYRRHPLGWWVGSALVLLNVFYLSWVTWALGEARRARQEASDRARDAEDARDRVAAARSQADHARQAERNRTEELRRRVADLQARSLAQFASEEGDEAAARQKFDKALAMASRRFEILQMMGAYHFRRRSFTKALEAYRRAYKRGVREGAPADHLVSVLLDRYWCLVSRTGRAGRVIFRSPEADAILHEMVRIDPKGPAGDLAGAMKSDDLAAKLQLIDRAIRRSPSPPFVAYAIRGRLRADTGLHEKALADYDAALRISPEQPDLLSDRGFLLLLLLKPKGAHRDFTGALRLVGSGQGVRPYLCLGRGLAGTLLRRFDQAEADMKVALGDAELLATMFLERIARYPQGAMMAELALTTHIASQPRRGYLRGLRGMFRIARARKALPASRKMALEQALADLKEAVRLDPDLKVALDRYMEEATSALRK